MTIASKLKAARVRLSDLGVERKQASAHESRILDLDEQIAATEVEVATLTIEEREARDASAIDKLRKVESSQVSTIVKATIAMSALLEEHAETTGELNGIRPGASCGAVRRDLHSSVATQITAWEKQNPELMGLPPLPSRGEARLIDAQNQLVYAESNKSRFERVIREAGRKSLPNQKTRTESLKRNVQHTKAVVAWAKKCVDERRPAEPRPVFRSDPDSVVRMGTPGIRWLS